jgi:hypothetical protein
MYCNDERSNNFREKSDQELPPLRQPGGQAEGSPLALEAAASSLSRPA